MTHVSSVSPNELRERRQSLRRQRRIHLLQGSWQILAMTGLTAGLFWGATRPIWLIKSADQIEVKGNHLLSDQAIQSLIPIEYPKPLLKVEPATLAQQLQSRAPITQATVTRQLFPPQLQVQVQERVPVAVALPPADASRGEGSYIQVGLLDAEGVWMPQSSFTFQGEVLSLPELKVRGMQEQYRPYWPEIYQAVIQSPITISELDWQDPANLILHTDLGMVHVGSFPDRFKEKLSTLDQMRDLTKQFDRKQLAFIDLSNPDLPSIQVLQATRTGVSAP
ncbi:MAG: FtsQ-type POTRA domain-containing protein [Cyanobacteria bacterium Co-bin8]|nr:FtsQ-type POTRA domain-containing protein [Cyanobacteria bacterium Co-bin8]